MTTDHAAEIRERLAVYLTRFADEDLRTYLCANSRLPGPRANLELASAFATAVRDQRKEWKAMWALCARWTAIPPEAAPTNDPREFAVFCGVRGIGALGADGSARAREALAHLRPLARDSRWRVREAVAMAIQDVAEGEPGVTLRALDEWIGGDAWLEMRAVAAGVAEPRVLKEARVALAALELHEAIVKRFQAAKDRDSADFRTLRQCLAYSMSVVVAARPEEGFRWMMKLAGTKDPDVLWIVKENLKKGRLASRNPGWVERIQATIRHG